MKLRRYSKKRYPKKMAALVMSVALTFSLAGCGRQTVDYNIEGGEDGSTSSDDASSAALKNALGVDEDVWETELASSDGVYNNVIYAKTSVPDTGYMSVLEMEKKTITNEDRKRIVEALFDADTIYVEGEDIPSWYLEVRLSETEQSIVYWDARKLEVEQDESYIWTDFNEEIYQDLLSEREELRELLDSVQGIGSRTSDYSESKYFGDIDGIHYWLEFTENGFYCQVNDCSDLTTETLLEDGMLVYDGWDDEASSNQCTMSREDMEKRAEDILAVCGLDAYMVNDAVGLEWYNYSEDKPEEGNTWYDGYSFTYVRNVNGIAVDDAEYDGVYSDDREDITVQLNGQGLAQIIVENIYEVKEVASEQASMLSYSQIKGMIQNKLTSASDLDGVVDCYRSERKNRIFTQLELIYAMIADDEESRYALIPVWRLSSWSNDKIDCSLCINAIDGSVADILYLTTAEE